MVRALTPSGVLRASIDLGNPILAHEDTATGAPVGVSVDLARAFTERLGFMVIRQPMGVPKSRLQSTCIEPAASLLVDRLQLPSTSSATISVFGRGSMCRFWSSRRCCRVCMASSRIPTATSDTTTSPSSVGRMPCHELASSEFRRVRQVESPTRAVRTSIEIQRQM